jgi:hypothetical protein
MNVQVFIIMQISLSSPEQRRLNTCVFPPFYASLIAAYYIIPYTVTKAKLDAGAQHAGDGKFRHPRR